MKQTSAILLSVFVFIASINIIVNQHFCNEELESIAFFIKAQPCEHATSNSKLPPCHAQKVKDQKKCCEENNVIVEAVDWLKVVSPKIRVDLDLVNIASFELKEIDLTDNKSSKYSPQKVPKPPDENDHIYVRHQAFLL